MKRLYLFLLIFIGLILQVTIFSHLTIFGIKPDIVLIIVLAISFYQGAYRGMAYGFWGGLLEDVFSSSSLGTNALSKVLCGFLASFLGRKVYENIGTQITLIVIFSILERIFTGIIVFFSPRHLSFSWSIFSQTLFFILYNLLIGLMIIPIVRKLSDKNERTNHA